eukprot:5354372-Amphidinium_carterae.1
MVRLWLLARFVLSELVWVFSHYCCCCARRRFRAIAMRVRPYVVASGDSGDAVVLSPSRPSTARLSLADIQLQISGGRACIAQRCRRARFAGHRKRGLLVTYSPQRAGHCLFAVVAEACWLTHRNKVSVYTVRRVLFHLLQQADQGEVAQVAQRFQLSLADYLAETLRSRWGTNFDLKLLAQEYELPLSLLNRHTGKFLLRSELPGPQITVGFKDFHFTLVRLGKKPARKATMSSAYVAQRRSTQ